MQKPPQQKAGAFGATASDAQRTVTVATFRFAKPQHFDIVRLKTCAHAGDANWLRRRATSGLAAVILGLADGRRINSNMPAHDTVTLGSGEAS